MSPPFTHSVLTLVSLLHLLMTLTLLLCDLSLTSIPFLCDPSLTSIPPQEMLPFAVMGADGIYSVNGRKVRGREYFWGVADVENAKYCDFSRLRYVLFRCASFRFCTFQWNCRFSPHPVPTHSISIQVTFVCCRMLTPQLASARLQRQHARRTLRAIPHGEA